jgi:uncharacterized protein YcbK (DUF882 family)
MSTFSRRQFVAAVSAAVPVLAFPRWLSAGSVSPRVLGFSHLHTGERLAVEYFTGGRCLPDALRAIDHILRDFRTGEVHAIDEALLDLLYGLSDRTGSTRPFEVISGYRSPATNRMLRVRSEGVAAGSLHMKGQAIDIRLSDISLARLRDAAQTLRRGGVGYYPASAFVHVDTGRVRTW